MISNNYFTFYLLFSVVLLAQTTFSQTTPKDVSISETWEVIESKENLIFSIRNQECDLLDGKAPLIFSFLRIENTGSESKLVRFNYGLQYFEGCSGCDDFSENSYSITIPPNTVLEGNCLFEDARLNRLIYNPNLGGGWKYKKTIITNISVQ